jgi:DNA-binding PadR family transcriptional regulator
LLSAFHDPPDLQDWFLGRECGLLERDFNHLARTRLVFVFKSVPGSDNFEDDRLLDSIFVNVYNVSNMGSNNSLGQSELVVLSAVKMLRENAYGRAIWQKVCELSGDKDVNLGGVYVTLERLREKGLLDSWMANPTPERGGRSKRYYKLEPPGALALEESLKTTVRITEGLTKTGGLKWRPFRIK